MEIFSISSTGPSTVLELALNKDLLKKATNCLGCTGIIESSDGFTSDKAVGWQISELT